MKRKLLLIVASLLVSGMMFAQDLHWSDFNINAFLSNAHITGRAYLDGVLVSDRETVEVAAFVGDELRGTKLLVAPFPQTNVGYFIWTNYFFNTEGETFTFKAYDHESGIEYDLCDVELTGIQNGYGTVNDPIEMHFTRSEEPEEPFSAPEYPWVPSTAYSGEGMLVTAQIQINGQLVERATYEVGAFCGDECRGNSNAGEGALLDDWTDVDMGYFAFMNVMGNDGDVINFYLYDIENSCVVEGTCDATVTLQNGGEVGTNIFGGDLFVLNFVTNGYTLDIEAYTPGEADKFYLIASPVGQVSPENVTNMLSNTYDLYYFDQSQELEWINYKYASNNFTMLEPGKGYLYANSGDGTSTVTTLTFPGSAYSGSGEVALTRDENAVLKGWNLVGNPFAQTAYVTKAFYTMNQEGTEVISVTGNSVEAMEGIFVVADEGETSMTFSTEAPAKGNQQIVVNVNRNRGNVVDRAIVRFNDAQGLPKFQINKNNTKLYIPQNGNDYAVVNSEAQGEVPVNFKASENGTYSIIVNAEEVNVNYLHLIDNMTGADVDLLATPSYSFEAKKSDYPTRFKLVFATGNPTDDSFAFFCNGSWIINNDGQAILQVVDLNGRILSSEQVNGSCSKSIKAATGVYLLRLINGDNVKVQKIVVE